MHSRTLRFLFSVLCLGTAATAIAQNPFVGEWKMNPDKSKMTGDVIMFAPAANGAIQYTEESRSYTFKTDGNEYETSTGAKTTWKMTDAHTYQSTLKRNGIDLGTTTWKISDDGKKLMLESTGTTPSGKSFDDTATYMRVTGSSGLMGSWKDTEVKINKEPMVMSLKAGPDDNTIHWEMTDLKAAVDLSMDGKEATPVGPTVPVGLTLSAKKTGPKTFTLVEKMNGKVLENMSYKVSEDGKTLTEVVTPPDGKAPATMIYDKQSM